MLRMQITYGNTFKEIIEPSQSKSNPSKKNTNEWSCFVRLNPIEGKTSSDFIERIEFLLHETFSIPLVKCAKSPF